MLTFLFPFIDFKISVITIWSTEERVEIVFLCLQAIGFEGDVRKRQDAIRVLESTVKYFGRLDILVNAAAGNFLVPAEDLTPNGFRTGIASELNTSHV